MTAQYLYSAAYRLHFYLVFPPTISSAVLCIGHSVSPSPWTYPLLPSISHPSTHILSLFAPASSPPSLARLRINRPPGRRSCLPAATACLCFPPMPGGPKELLARAVPAFSILVAPPYRNRPVPSSLSAPGFPA